MRPRAIHCTVQTVTMNFDRVLRGHGKVSEHMTQALVRVQNVEPGEGYTATVRFTDGSCRTIDLSLYLHGHIFEPIHNDVALFRAMVVEEGTITWPNGADIDPDVLYHGLKPVWDTLDEENNIRG